ncbi:MAG: NADH-quinone oxidoreductase subunit M [Chloroflexota bacterium]|nr:NADH-quinone oxidoreductase subunit M [Chloroflexota bacterium]
MIEFGFPILSTLIFLPLVGAVITAILPREHASKSALLFAVATFLLSLPLVFSFEPTAEFQFVERFNWIAGLINPQTGEPQFLIEYYLGLDGISLWLIPLTTLLSVLAIWFSSDSIHEQENQYYAFMLLLETGMLGVFLALDLFLFFVFWEVVLIPMYFLIGIWGGSNRIYATIKFVLYTMAGSAFMLATIVALGLVHLFLSPARQIAFAIDKLQPLAQNIPAELPFLPGNAPLLMFLAFAIAFAIKVPLFPFHTWLPDAHVQAPTAGSVILAGVLLKMGTYGYLRFALPLFPNIARELAPIFAILAIIGILYGAWVAYAQRDIKSLVAYSSVSHLGFVMLGIFALNAQGLSGGVLQMVNHGLSTGALFLLVGMIYERRHTRDVEEFGGLWAIVPVYAIFFLVTMLASVGLPGLNGFVGEFLTLLGAWRANPWWAAFATFGVVLAATYLFRLFGRMMFGPIDNPENRTLTDLTGKEIAVLAPLVMLMILIGFAPNLFLLPMQPSIDALVEVVNGAASAGLVQ